MSISKLKTLIDLGREGKNVGLQIGLPKLESKIDGLTSSTYYLIGGGTSSGKTSLLLYSFIYKPFMNRGKRKVQFIYYSLEMPEEILQAKLISIYIYEKYNKILTVKDILSKNRGTLLSNENYEIICKAYSWLEELDKCLTIYDKGLTANKLYAHLSTELEKYGKVIETDNKKTYVPNDDNQLITVMIDHIGLIRATEGRKKKEEIDLASSYLVTLKNRCGISPIVLSQINRQSSSMDRRNANFQEIELQDFKDTGNPAEDADNVIAIYNPFREKVATYKGYDIKILQHRFRGILILKNRYGETDISVGTLFYGEIGSFKELPKASEINDYEKYITPPEVEKLNTEIIN